MEPVEIGGDMDEALLTTKEVAALLRVSSETVRRLVIDNELLGFRVGRSYRIPRSAVDKIVHREPRARPKNPGRAVSTPADGR